MHVPRAFRSATGISPCGFATERWDAWARALLVRGGLAMVEIAAAVGAGRRHNATVASQSGQR